MKIASFRAFAQAREEIWFWPSAALAYYVTITDSALVLGGFVISLFAGAVTYKLHESLREFFEEKKYFSGSKTCLTERNGRFIEVVF